VSNMTVKEQMEAMLAGVHEDVVEESVEEEAVENSTTDTADVEDTDQEEAVTEETETEEENDDSIPETEDEVTDTEEENAQEAVNDDKSENTIAEEPNYKEFYEKVALAKFTANGREVEGFKDPADLIRAQQMLHGYSDKMKVFKEYKKFIKPLEERNLMNDPDKFNFAMSLLDGDTEAIKKVIKDKGIDPLELDLEDIQYVTKNTLATDTQILLDDVSTQARNLGIESRFHQVLTKDFDDASLQEFLENPAVRADLLRHLQDGSYDIVQNEIRTMEMLDAHGELDKYSTVDKYRLAVKRLQAQQPTVAKPTVNAQKVEAEKARIKDDRTAAEFKKKAEAKEKEVAEQRKKAASVSTQKAVKKAPEVVKPESLKGDDFRNYFKNMMMQ